MNISEQLTPNDVNFVLAKLGIEAKGDGWKTIKSPLRDEKNPSFGINPQTGAWKDHSTGKSGDLVNLVAALRQLPLKDATVWIAGQTDLSGALYNPPKNGKTEPKPEFWGDKNLSLIKAGIQRLKTEPGHELLATVREYDCLEPETLQKFGCGIVAYWYAKDKKEYEWLAFPYATGCQLYRRDEDGKIMYSVKGSTPGAAFFGIKKTKGRDTLFIAKSPRETMLLFQEHGNLVDVVGLCTGEQGNISKEQIEALRNEISASKYSNIYVFLDCDTETAYSTAKEFSEKIMRATQNENVRLVNIHQATGAYKDVTDCYRAGMDEKSFRALLEDAEKVSATNASSATNATPKNGTNDVSTAPPVPNDVYKHLPRTLQTRCGLIEQRHRKDVFLISALPVLAAHMPKVKAGHADGYYTPDLFTLIVADPGSGKGTASKARKLGSVLNSNLIEKSRREIADFNDLPDEAKSVINEPKERALFIPANSSSRAIYDTLETNGGSGLLFESEIDTMLAATGQEWGNFSDITRKAFHHESVSINRKTDRFFIEEPRLSICLSGTFDQFKKMFESAENGHFSRYALYTFDVPRKWQSHRPTKQSRALDESVQTASENLFQMYRILNSRTEPLYIDLEPEQWQAIDETFAEKMQDIEDLGLSPYLHASNNRAAVLALRMASMFAVLRTYEDDPERLQDEKSITPAESDLIAALWLANSFVEHAVRLYQILPKAEKQNSKGERFEQFVAALPSEFETAEAVNIGEQMDIPPRTVKRWLSGDQRFNRKQRGHYEKT